MTSRAAEIVRLRGRRRGSRRERILDARLGRELADRGAPLRRRPPAVAFRPPRVRAAVQPPKRREILLWDNVRIHLDDVAGLGTFLELEAVVDARHDDVICRAQVATVLSALGLGEGELIRASYAELLSSAARDGSDDLSR